MQRYLIERHIPGAGEMSSTELCGAARSSNQAIAQLGSQLQWEHSYVADGKIFCVYLADSEEVLREHASMSGIPIQKITPIHRVIDPLTGFLE